MTPATDLVLCANCDGLFTTASSDDVFFHATCRCRQKASATKPGVNPRPGEEAPWTDNGQLTTIP